MPLGRILVKGTPKGTGFALAMRPGEPSRVVLTARHVVKVVGAKPFTLHASSDIVFATETGQEIQVESVEGNGPLDVAVMRLKEAVSEGFRVHYGARQETKWQTEARLHASLPILTGTVTKPRLRIENADKYDTVAMQLRVEEELDDFAGYSGSPVTLLSQADAVIGLVVEQVLSQLEGHLGEAKRATNVMYATPIRDVLEEFGLTAATADPPVTVSPPDLPAHALSREGKLSAIKEDLREGLLDDAEQVPSGRTVALVGMGGAGKTVLAAQLARDPDLRSVFLDGVFWIGLARWDEQERESSLVARQALLAEVLGEAVKDFADSDLGRSHLRGLLADRACLIVLDGVRERKDLDAFNVLGPRGRLLFTTRERGLAESYAEKASVYELELLIEDQARGLLADYARLDAEALPPEADKVLKHCGGLPLAIAMAGAMVQGRPKYWPSLLKKFEKARIDQIASWLTGYDHPNLLVALDVGVEDLDTAGQAQGLSNARDRYTDLAVFAGRRSFPETAMAALWWNAGVEDYEVRDYADLFVSRSLATWDRAEERLSLHDLQMDYLANRAREQLQALHTRLVDGYAHHCPDGWASGPDDGYFFQNLPYHLAEAGRGDELRALLADIFWIRNKLAATGVASLVSDYNLVIDDPGLRLVGEALRMSAQALTRDPGHLEGQLLGRLADQDDQSVQRLLDTATLSRTGAWLRPLTRSLTAPGGLVRRVLRAPDNREKGYLEKAHIEHVFLSEDGRFAVCQAQYGNERFPVIGRNPQLLIWDLQGLNEPRKLPPLYPRDHLVHDFDRLAVLSSDGGTAVYLSRFAENGFSWKLDLMNLESGAIVGTIRTGLTPIEVAIADNSQLVTVGCKGGWVICWELGGSSSKEVQVFPHGDDVMAIATSADGSAAVALSRRGSVVHLQLPDLQAVKSLVLRAAQDPNQQFLESDVEARHISLSPDGNLAVTGDVNKAPLDVWDLQQDKLDRPGRLLFRRTTLSSPITNPRNISAISVIDGNRAVIWYYVGSLQVWDLTHGQLLATVDLADAIYQAAVTRDGRTALATVSRDRVLVLDLTVLSAQPPAVDQDRPFAIAVTPDGHVAFTGSTRGTLTRFEIPPEPGTAKVRSRVVAKHGPEVDWGIVPTGRLSFSGDWTGKVPVFSGLYEPPRPEYDQGIYCDIRWMGVTPDGQRVVWASSDARVTIWAGADQPPCSVRWHRLGLPNSVVATSTGFAVAITRPLPGEVVFGNIERLKWGQWEEADDDKAAIDDPELAYDERLLAYDERPTWVQWEKANDGKVFYGKLEQAEWRRWGKPDEENLPGLSHIGVPEPIRCVSAPHESLRVLGLYNGVLVFEERGGPTLHARVHESGVETIAATQDGAVVVSGAANGTVAVWQPRLTDQPRVVLGHPDAVQVVAVAPDRRFAVSGSAADDLILWALPKLTPLASYHCDGAIYDIAIAADARLVALVDGAGGVHLLSTLRAASET